MIDRLSNPLEQTFDQRNRSGTAIAVSEGDLHRAAVGDGVQHVL